MLTDRAKIHFHNRLKDIEREQLTPYAGHDTVGMVGLDVSGDMVAGTSTSGLFMKKPGVLETLHLSDLDYMSTARLVAPRNGSRGGFDERRDFV